MTTLSASNRRDQFFPTTPSNQRLLEQYLKSVFFGETHERAQARTRAGTQGHTYTHTHIHTTHTHTHTHTHTEKKDKKDTSITECSKTSLFIKNWINDYNHKVKDQSI